MTQELLFVIISILILWIGNFFYLRDILVGRSFPHPISYGIWFVLIGFNTYILAGEKEWYSFSIGLFNTLTCIIYAGFGIYCFSKIRKNGFDYFCLFLSFLLIAYWLWTRNNSNTIILTIIIDLIASLPTLKKAWLQPWTETISLYFSSFLVAALTILSLKTLTFDATAFWVYLIFINTSIINVCIFRRWYLKWWKSIFE